MVPIATADLQEDVSLAVGSVYPPKNADVRLKELWTRHGDPQSSRYSNPELTSLSSLVRFNARKYPEAVAYLVPKGDLFEKITWRQFDALTNLSAGHYAETFGDIVQAGNPTSSQPTIALLGTGNTFEYWVTQIGLCKLGIRLLLLSDKNADIARNHLLEVCDAKGIVVEQKYWDSIQGSGIKVATMVKLDDLQTSEPSSDLLVFASDDVWNQHSMIIHSSGSTGLPKPIIHTNRSLMLIARMYRLFQSFVVENWYLCFPLYHIAGVSIILGGIPSALPTSFPPENWPPSPGAILSAWRRLDELQYPVDCLHCAPSVIEDLYEYMSMNATLDLSPFLNLKILQPGGAALSPVLLKELTGMGVNVKTTYGSTEIGPPFRTIPDTRDNPGCYHVRNLFPGNQYVQMEPQGEGLFECVVYKGFELAAELWQTPDAPNPYRTSDLFLEDPPGSGLFVLQGRKDDILVHSNGEKTNALPLQMAIEECHPGINKVMVFGTNQPCTSAVLELVGDNTSDMEEVFQSIAEACKGVPTYSRVDRSMVLVVSKSEKLPVTPKGNVRRKEAWKLYGARIEALYSSLLDGDAPDEANVINSDLEDLEFVRQCVAHVSSLDTKQVSDDASFYHLGLNSQMAVRLRPLLVQRFGKFPLMFVFEYPSVFKLTDALSKIGQNAGVASPGRHFAWIQDAISRYTAEIQTWTKPELSSSTGTGQVVYLTGATGALGNALLAELVLNDEINKVYCAIRGDDARKRLAEQLSQRGYGSNVFTSDKIVAVPYYMSAPGLGLDENSYELFATEVTMVIHNAWKMDFNQQVDMFESDCLRGTLNLMRFCQTKATKKFVFTSSVATNMGKAAANRLIGEVPIANDPSLALETGYAQSKFIVEIVSQAYAEITKSPVQICRVGQLCGHTTLGSWNTTEMFPIMIATGLNHLNAMPTFERQTVDWLPVDICANVINTIVSKPSPPANYTLHNLVNPSATSWSTFLEALEAASGVHFERIGMREWVARLQEKSEKTQDVPGAKLLGFFEAMVDDEDADVRFDTTKTAAMVPRLRECSLVGEEMLRLYLEKWKADGFVV